MIIADAVGIKDYVINNYKILHDKIKVIEYGAEINDSSDQEVLNRYGLTHDGYYLVVCRLEPENHVHMIIEGYLLSKSDKPLVVVGGLSDTAYVNSLRSNSSEKIRFLGGIYNKHDLSVIRASSFAYLHGHSVGGTNPSLLEAMGSGNIAICHDNVFNREVTNSLMYYFSTSNELSEVLLAIENLSPDDRYKLRDWARNRIVDYYNWDSMSNKYLSLLNNL